MILLIVREEDQHFLVIYKDTPNVKDHFPVASLKRTLAERDKFFETYPLNASSQFQERNNAVAYYVQGASDDNVVVDLLPGHLETRSPADSSACRKKLYNHLHLVLVLVAVL